MKRAVIVVIALGVVAASVGAYYSRRNAGTEPTVTTATAVRGDIVEAVGATGTLQAVTTVLVGTQVSGTIQQLNADFNSLVHKGQVLARLDPSLFETQIEQARANLIRAQADVQRFRVALEDTRTKLARAQELSDRTLIPRTELETAQVNVRSAEAQVQSAQAQVTQAQASLNQNEVNLQHTVIEAPIDGLIISRNVDVGQTVAASMQAPTLFVLAADLTKMQVIANLDESDVGRIRPGQRADFRVDAYPADDFAGTVSQVRLQPIIQQNVVTYATVIDVPNPALKLKPGMTANVSIEIARRTNVVRIPNTALRFRPTNEIFAALGQTPPPPGGMERGQANARRTPSGAVPGPDAPAPPSKSAADASVTPRRDGGTRGRGNFEERLQNLSPEERDRVLQRMRERSVARGGAEATPGVDAGTAGRSAEAGRPSRPGRQSQPAPAQESVAARNPQATTIDALFGPLPTTESVGRVWLYVDKQLKPARVRLGISDGQATELIEGDVQPGMELVSNVATGATPVRSTGGAGGFPLLGQNPRGFTGGGGGRGR
jgi:HlyD family secretion protein